VAQQYLPTALQGQLFWQPGRLGWEGERRGLQQQRRAAQLAAAVEHAAEQGEALSSAPDDPALERWLQRQLSHEGQRLDRLRERLWEGARWQRHDRVLILEARSLLWALDPLQHTPEGGVVLQAASDADSRRLEAHLQVLDPLQRPRLVAAADDDLVAALEPAECFEWIAGRHPWRQSNDRQLDRHLGVLSALASPGAQLRLLFSRPLLGPAGALLALANDADRILAEVLERVAAAEVCWLAAPPEPARLEPLLQGHGWCCEQQHWQEDLELSLSAELLNRWLEPQGSYRRQLQQLLSTDEEQRLLEALRQRQGQRLPQRLGHQLLIGRHQKAPA